MRLPLLVLCFLLVASAAQAQLTLCNRTAQPVQVAVAEEALEDEEIVVKGWTRVAPGACVAVADNLLYDYAFFAWQPGSGRTWEDDRDGPRLCLRMGTDFRIAYEDPGLEYDQVDDFSCPAGAVKRGFIVLPNDGDPVRHDLK